MCKFRFSPSAIDKWQRLLGAEADFESDFNWSDESGYKKSLEEIVEERTQDLLNALNHAPQEPSEAAARGTAFNEMVDEFIQWMFTEIDYGAIRDKSGRVVMTALNDELVSASCEGFDFTFDRGLVEAVAIAMQQGTMQMHIQAPIHTSMGDVLLHGYPDYILPASVTDLKTTESYTFGKYEHYSQRYVYPYILHKCGLMERIDWFEFLVVEMKKDKETGVISGQLYRETYTDVSDFETCENEVKWLCEGLAQFCDEHRDQITNPKIFNQND